MHSALKLAALTVAVAAFAACASKSKTETAPTAAAAAPAAKAAAAPATPAPAKSGATVCTKGSDVRTIEVAAKDGGCEVHYTKSGKTTTPASSKMGTKFCDGKVSKMKTHLTSAGYKCEG